MKAREFAHPERVSEFVERGEHESVSEFVSELSTNPREVRNPDTPQKVGSGVVRVRGFEDEAYQTASGPIR